MLVLQWWEDGLQCAYALHKARMFHDDAATRKQAPEAPVPAYLRPRAEKRRTMPRVQIRGRGSRGAPLTRGAAKRMLDDGGQSIEEEREAMVNYVVTELAAELYIELTAAFPPST
jgi:hypothetical protein